MIKFKVSVNTTSRLRIVRRNPINFLYEVYAEVTADEWELMKHDPKYHRDASQNDLIYVETGLG